MRPLKRFPSPILLYAQLCEASSALARQIDLLDVNEPALAQPLYAAWLHLDHLIEQLPPSLAQEEARCEDHARAGTSSSA